MHDFYSDTKTRPTRAMREAMLDAPVGDEQKFEDPTTTRLEERVADLLGKEAAVFLPSGTMCNQIAVHLHTRPGDEFLCDRTCHVVNSEGGGASGASSRMAVSRAVASLSSGRVRMTRRTGWFAGARSRSSQASRAAGSAQRAPSVIVAATA